MKKVKIPTTAIPCIMLAIIFLSITSANVAQATNLDTALSVTGGSARLKYEYKYTLGIDNLGGTPIEMTVIQYYIVVISDYNSTHVRVDSGPVGNATVAFISGSWISLGSFISWAASNISNFIQGFIIRSIDSSYIPKDKLSDVLSAIMGVSPIKEIDTTDSCVVISVDGALFEARKYDVGLAGEVYYDCKTGVLLQYRDISSTPVDIGGETVKVTKTLNVKLVAANNELLKYMIVGTEEGGEQQIGGYPIEWVLLAASGALLIASVAIFIRAYRSSRHHK